MVAITTCAVLCLFAAPSGAFVNARRHVQPGFVRRFTNEKTTGLSSLDPPDKLRGGDNFLRASGADYSEAARVLFGNVISPAAMLTGGLVPLGFLADPLPADKPWQKKMQCLYYILSVFSLANELMAIMFATVASNKLTETVTAPAASVFALIKRDYELSWIATNVHFMLGLFGFVGLIMLRALVIFPVSLNSAAAGLAGAALLAMCSVVNVGVSEGDGRGHVFGGNMLFLGARYIILLAKQIQEKKGVMAVASLTLAVVSTVRAVRNLMQPETLADA